VVAYLPTAPLVDEGLLTPAEALAHLDGIDLNTVVRTSFAPPVPRTSAVAEVASMGVASGVVALDPAAVKRLSLLVPRQSSFAARR
jgi:pyruvate, orthophosphate dikinase